MSDHKAGATRDHAGDKSIATIRINGGRLCLDFVNTAAYGAAGIEREFLSNYADLVTWGQRQGLIDRQPAAHLLADAKADARAAVLALKQARSLRAALRDLFAPAMPATRVAAAVAALNSALKKAAPNIRLGTADAALRYAPITGLEAWLLVPLLISALDLATSPARSAIHMCPGEDCHWLFIDLSRNGARRWCSMQSCGNKAKARTHYETHRAPSAVPRSLREGRG